MRTLFIIGFVLLFVLTAAANGFRYKKARNGRNLLRRKAVGPKEVMERQATASINRPKGKDPRKKKLKKNQHYVDPKILKQLKDVKNFKDFVKKFQPKGFTVKKKKVIIKMSKPMDKLPNKQVIGINGNPGPAIDMSLGAPGSVNPNSVYVEVEKEDVYYQGQQIADPLQSSSSDQVACNPKDTTYSIAKLGVITYPSCVILKKCGGCCDYAKECVAATTTNKTIPVVEIFGANFISTNKNFTEDKTCKCDCIVKASDCLPTQTYSKDRCQCECSHSVGTCPTGKIWSKGDCDCVCSNRQECSSALRKWDESSCSCACIDTPCPDGKARNQESCLCPSC